jgi:hypothetical protein
LPKPLVQPKLKTCISKITDNFFDEGAMTLAMLDIKPKDTCRYDCLSLGVVMLGNEEDFSACLGFEVEGMDEKLVAGGSARVDH